MLAIATAALLLAVNLEAAVIKYNHESRDTHVSDGAYEHNRGDDYPEPSHKSHYADQYHGHKPSYEIQDYSLRPHHDSYDEDYYGRYAYSVEPSYSHESSSPYKQTHLPHYRHKRGADKKDDDEDGKDEKDDDDGDDEEEEETEVDTETWVNLADSLSLIARKLADRDDDGEGDGEEDDDDDDDDDDEEMKMSEASTYSYEPIGKSKKYSRSHEPRSYRNKRATSQAMEETMDLVDGLREEQKRKLPCPKIKVNKKCCKFCRKCVLDFGESSCDGFQARKCKKISKKCVNRYKIVYPPCFGIPCK